METLKENMMSEIKKAFDAYLEEADEEACNYLLFDDLEDFKEFYSNYCNEYFNSDNYSPIDDVLFTRKYDFDWFDAFKIIKEYWEAVGEPFDDYDDEQASWDAFCYACANQAKFIELEVYELWFITPKQKLVRDCDIQIQHINDADETTLYRNTLFLKKTTIQYYEYLKEFNIDKANENLQVINLLFQKKMIEFEKGIEQKYLEVCNMCKRQYDHILKFKERANKLKHL